jgi:membrane protein YdbS with pleckstrin-like domain
MKTVTKSEGNGMNIGEEFHPSPKMMLLYFTYLVILMIPLYAIGFGVLFLLVYYFYDSFGAMIFALFYLLPITIILLVAMYWIPKYYRSIKYIFTESEVRAERGVWWKIRQAVPSSRIMNAETIQGPISRHYKIGTVDIYTAGYTGQGGGTGGPGTRRSEASFMNREDFLELREQVLGLVKGRPLFGAPAPPVDSIQKEMLEELKEIRKLLGR